MTARRRGFERTIAALAAVLAAAVVLVAPVTVSGGSVAWGTSCADAAPAQATVAVGLVVDFGVLKSAGDPGSLQVTCVPLAPGTNGLDLLEATGHRYRLSGSGLLCAIDGRPVAPACGTPNGSGFDYWSYWIGGSSWTYATVGPASRAMLDGTVEGWRFVTGGNNVAPSTSASFAALTS